MENKIINEKLQNVIDILNINKVKMPVNDTEYLEKRRRYETASAEMKEDIFKLLDYIELFDSIPNINLNNAYYINLINTLSVLKNNSLVELTPEQKSSIRDSKLYKYLVNALEYYAKKYEQYSEKIENGKRTNDLFDEIIEKIRLNNNKLIDDELLEQLFDLIINKKIDDIYCTTLRKNILEYNISIFQNMKNQILVDEDSQKERTAKKNPI